MFFKNNTSSRVTVDSWVKQYSREFYQYAYLRLNRHEDAEDVVQLTFIKAFRAFNTFKPGSSEKAWLYTILNNNLKDHLRRVSGRPQQSPIDEEIDIENLMVDPKDSPEVALIKKQEQDLLSRGIANLPEHFAAPLLMREVSDMSYKDIADYLSVPIGTVMSRLSRARKALFEILTMQDAALLEQNLAQPDAKNTTRSVSTDKKSVSNKEEAGG